MKKTLGFFLIGIALSCCKQNPSGQLAEIQLSQSDNTISVAQIYSQNTRLSPENYIEWVRDPEHGLVSSESIDGLKFSVFYKPIDYVVLQELRSQELPVDSFLNVKARYDGLYYVTLSIKNEESDDILKYRLQDDSQFHERISYCSFSMQNDLQLIDGRDTLNCSLYHFERTYQIAPYANFVLGFEKTNASRETDTKTLVLHDRVFGKGIVKLKIAQSALANIPKLSIN